MRCRCAGSLGFATNSQAPSARAWRALAASFCPESTKIFICGACACTRRSGAERTLVIADASHEGPLKIGLAVALAKRARAAAKAQPRALKHRDRRAQLVDVSEHVRCKEQAATLPAQAAQHGF